MSTLCCSLTEKTQHQNFHYAHGLAYLKSIGSKIGQRVWVWRQKRKLKRADRIALKHVATLNDSALKDIGLTRTDILWAGNLPSSVSASVELEKIARGGRMIQ